MSRGVRVALLNQHHAEQLDLDQSGLDFLISQYRAQHQQPGVSQNG
jgi:hypothetical protein